jgi:hypothetical protein
MFSEGGRVDSIFSGNEHLSSIREAGPRPTSFVGNIEKSQTIFGENLQFAEDGNLVGIRSGAQDVTYNFTPANRPASTGSIQFGRSFGGGILGSPVYLDSVQNFVNLKPDAATKMPRNFAKSVFNDFLCRSFPVVELNDIDSTRYVDPAAKISFRTSASCVSCHASMDRLGAVSRGIFMELVGEGIPNNNRLGVRFFNSITPDQSAETAWPVSPDANYHRRPTTGRLFFRNYRNNLLDIPLDDINSLGRVLASLDEPYICLTSRYYEYLTGISVDITYKNPENMSSAAKLHRDRVIQMGRSLKSHQNLRTTLKEIISSDSF